MTQKLRNALFDLQDSNIPLELFGVLFAINGSVEVPNRDSFVYVSLRDNPSELIQAFNEKVSPVDGLPVKLKRQGNYYYIIGRDTERYNDWQSFSPFLPRHGDQHSFNRMGGGGDIVWVYSDQFMPMLAIPSGTAGSNNVVVSNFMLRNSTRWLYIGGTGTSNIIQYKPTDNQAIMVLVYVDRDTGNPQLLVNSGTPFAASLTGSSSIAPYIPYPSNTSYLPVVAIRLVSGTNSILWTNMYDVRQVIDYHNTGTAGGGTPGGSDTEVQFNNLNTFDGDPRFAWNYTNGFLRVGPAQTAHNFNTFPLQLIGLSYNVAPTFAMLAYGTGTAVAGSPHPTYIGYRQGGTDVNTPESLPDNAGLLLLVGAGYNGVGLTNAARIRMSTQGVWITGTALGSKMELEVTPSGTTTRSTRFAVYGDSVNIPDGTYNVGGIPHTHSQYQVTGSAGSPAGEYSQLQYNNSGTFGAIPIDYTEIGGSVLYLIARNRPVGDSGYGIRLGGGNGISAGNGGPSSVRGGDADSGDAAEGEVSGGSSVSGRGGNAGLTAGQGGAGNGYIFFRDVDSGNEARFNMGLMGSTQTYAFPPRSGMFMLTGEVNVNGFITGSYQLLDGRFLPTGSASQFQPAGTYITGSYTLLNGKYQPSGSISTAGFITGSFTLLDGRYQPSGSLSVGYLYGLTLSNNGTDPTNDIDIASGKCRDNTDVADIVLASTLIKRLDATWAVGTNQGGLDTGTVTNATYHVFAIKRSDTGVVDGLFSTNPSTPVMPANYTLKRRIGSIVRTGAAIKAFVQDGNKFMWSIPVQDVNATNPGTAAVTRTLTIPTGLRLEAVIGVFGFGTSGATDGPGAIYISDLSLSDQAASSAGAFNMCAFVGSAISVGIAGQLQVFTNTSAQIRSRIETSAAGTIFRISTLGWIDTRGRLA